MSCGDMSEILEVLRRPGVMPDDVAAHARLLQPLLADAAGPGAEPVSLALDFGAPVAAGEPVTLEAWIDRATRTLVFAHARIVTAGGAMAASGSAVFRRQAGSAGQGQG
jgi:acyl-coenzyme A thioesterase PaaI-like protein